MNGLTARTTQARSGDADGAPVVDGVPGVARASRRERAWTAWRGLPGWGQVLAVYVASRVLVTFAIARHADRGGRRPDGSSYGYLDIAGNWDGTWYHRIVREGYPQVLPRGADGVVQESTWAFYPLYPGIVRAVMTGTGLSWPLAATLVSVLCGALAVVVMRSVVERVAGPRLAFWTVALFCVFPTAAVLQLPYSESLAVLLLVAVLACLQRRWYLAAVPLVLLVGVARPIGVPLAAVIALHALARVRRWRRGDEALGRGGLARLGVLGAAAAVAAVEWTLVVAAVTGEPGAYTQTMAAWRTPRVVVPFTPWWTAAQNYLGTVTGPLILAAVVVGLVVWLTRPAAAVIAGDLRAWCACYLAYLFAVLDSFTSLPRYLLPLFPLGTLLAAASPSRAYRVALVVAFAAGGLVWLAVIWRSSTMAP